MYHCKYATQCIPLTYVCDGERQCPHGDDEHYCGIPCPDQCDCLAYDINCRGRQLNSLPIKIPLAVKRVDLSINSIKELRRYDCPSLVKLNFSRNLLQQLNNGTFDYMGNLMELDISFNNITHLSPFIFHGLVSLKILILTGNQNLHTIHPNAFQGLYNLPSLDLSGLAIHELGDHIFEGLSNVTSLLLTDNYLSYISELSFSGLEKLEQLHLTGNKIKTIKRATFYELPALKSLSSDQFMLCCLASQVERENCFPEQDPISSCEDLMQNSILRAFIWILGVLAFLGNLTVLVFRARKSGSGVPDFIIGNLAGGDFLMGCYLLLIGSVDAHYKGVFIEYAEFWRDSWLCQFAGVLATFSSEASVMFLGLLTLDRFINILYPFSWMKLSRKTTKVVCSIIWCTVALITLIPLLPIPYFPNNYYGRSGVCMALPITNERPQG